MAEDAISRTIPLQRGILYGPVASRRLGSSLGINILPDEIKVCSLNCRYCQYSWTGMHCVNPRLFKSFLPSRESIRDTIEAMLVRLAHNNTPPDTITFSGNGEATLHPDFPAIVTDVAALRDAYAPLSRTAILSNSTTVHQKAIRDAMLLLDDPILKLDAGREKIFRKLNGPVKGVDFDAMVGGLRQMGPRLILQSLFVTGSTDNSSGEEWEKWFELAASIAPGLIQVYTLDRGPADRGLLPVPAGRLRAIAAAVREHGIKAEVFL